MMFQKIWTLSVPNLKFKEKKLIGKMSFQSYFTQKIPTVKNRGR
jgi:hypothetical protein